MAFVAEPLDVHQQIARIDQLLANTGCDERCAPWQLLAVLVAGATIFAWGRASLRFCCVSVET